MRIVLIPSRLSLVFFFMLSHLFFSSSCFMLLICNFGLLFGRILLMKEHDRKSTSVQGIMPGFILMVCPGKMINC